MKKNAAPTANFPGKDLLLPVVFSLLLGVLAATGTAGAGETKPELPPAQPTHGISIDGILKYPEGFEHFAYASPTARSGGELVLHDLGGFDKMNPFTLKGAAPAGLDSLVFEPLAVASLDEPFAAYGLIAQAIELADDRLSVTFTLNPLARFSDGTPVRVEDVKFSLETLKSSQAHPFYQHYLQDISRAEILDERRIRFHFARVNRELHLIAAQIPVLSEQFYRRHPFDAEGLTPPTGSGPYRVERVVPGRTITYRRNPDYWARDLNVRRGMFNFETITFKYFKDQIVSLEAFKAGEFDFMAINIAKQWARDLDGARFERGELVKEEVPHRNNAGMQGFVINTRRPIFQDRRVRQALNLAFDFEWTNRTMFYDQYTPCDSYFSNSYLAARQLPAGLELEYLEKFQQELPLEVFTTPLTPVSTDPPHSLRGNLLRAVELLAQAGWTVQNGVLRNGQGEVFSFEILLDSPSFERVMAPYVKNLQRLGMRVTYRQIDAALYMRRLNSFDFDMVVTVFSQSQSPGNEQRNYWHSTAADRPGSRNLAGIKDPVVDRLVDKIIYAETQEELIAATRALDRTLWHGYYVVPNWYLDSWRLTYRDTFARPETLPLYYRPFQLLMTWWMK
ncbi:extracellular solute-binding protein [Desulfurivibrio sp. D14AmB]|uniref:extracellular solute-binding protein n=1 Tax=Desulfurivibrio sp. D14AmB TaxID=3374370 RepID=UPI00376EF11A